MLYSGNSPEALSREGVSEFARLGIDRSIPVVCREMRRPADCEMAGERTRHTLQTTALAAGDPAKAKWKLAKVWLRREMKRGNGRDA